MFTAVTGEYKKRTLKRPKTRQAISFLLTWILKGRRHYCSEHSTCVSAGSSPCCDGSGPGAGGDLQCSAPLRSLGTMSSHPARPGRHSSATETSQRLVQRKQGCSFLRSPPSSGYPQPLPSIVSGKGYRGSGRHSIKHRSKTGTWSN